jgi:hypothetical protein
MAHVGFGDAPELVDTEALPPRRVILVAHCEEGEGPYFRSIGLRDFKANITGIFDVGDPSHQPTNFAMDMSDLDPYEDDDSSSDWNRVCES